MTRSRFNRAFTLVEIMIVVAILAILAMIVFFGARYYMVQSSEVSARRAMSEIQTALRLFREDSPDDVFPIETTPGGRSVALSLQTLIDLEYLTNPGILQDNQNIIYLTNSDGTQYWLAIPSNDSRSQLTTSGDGVYSTTNSGVTDTVNLGTVGSAIRFSNPERIDPTPNNLNAGIVIANPRNPNDRRMLVAPDGPPPGHSRFYDHPNFSASFWFRVPRVKQYEPLLLKRVAHTTITGCTLDSGCPVLILGGGWQIGLNQSGSQMQIQVTGFQDLGPVAPTRILDLSITNPSFQVDINRWYHLVITQAGSNAPVLVYLNGQLVGTSANVLRALNAEMSLPEKAADNHPYMLLGWGRSTVPGTPWVGSESDFDDLRLYATSLNLATIQSMYNNGRGMPGSRTEPNSVAGWSFDERPGSESDTLTYIDYVGFQTNLVSITERISNSINLACRASRSTALGCTADSLATGVVPLAIRGIISQQNRAFVVTGR